MIKLGLTLVAYRCNAGLAEYRNKIAFEEVCYDVLGCFDDAYPYDCLGTRNLPSLYILYL